jgi:cell wall-associated NlpC family hydrolase
MTAYRLNGYQLPRTSREQFRAGSPIAPEALRPADLVFFATRSGKNVSHVGIYIGDGRFIHAPGRGKTIRIDSLSQNYYRRRLVGARYFL